VAVKVEGDADRRMPEAFAGNLGMDTGRRHMRGRGSLQARPWP
jgi:hypothetical protein